MKLLLHNYRRCPFCIRTRIILHQKNIPHELIHEPLREWTDWMKNQAAKGEKPRVPALRIIDDQGNEKVMFESNDINLYLDANFGEVQFTPNKNSPEYTQMLEWWDWCSETLKPQIDLYKYGENRQFDIEKNQVHEQELGHMIQKLEDALGSTKTLIGPSTTLADIAIIPFIRQIIRTREGAFDFSPFPNTLSWSNAILEADWFVSEVMKKDKN